MDLNQPNEFNRFESGGGAKFANPYQSAFGPTAGKSDVAEATY